VRALALLTSLTCAACAAPIGSESSAIVNGNADTDDTAVVALHIVSANGPNNDALCSGTVVSPHVVLTAAHCLSADVVGPIDHVEIFLGSDAFDPNQASDPSLFVQVASTTFDPQFSASGTTHDIGVVVAAQPLAPTPIPLNHDSLGNGDVGTPVQAVGFGESNGTVPSSAGPRRTIDTTILKVDDEHIGLANVICEGDSGGPTYLTKNGQKLVAGVHSFTTSQTCNGDGDDTRVDKYTSFVDDAINEADPGFLSSGCNASGGSGEAFSIAIALAALARRKKSG
jgi:secreted trypsin-like serine protease